MSTKDKGAKKEEVKKEEVKKVDASKPTAAAANISDDLKNKQAYKKFFFRGDDITKLLQMPTDLLA